MALFRIDSAGAAMCEYGCWQMFVVVPAWSGVLLRTVFFDLMVLATNGVDALCAYLQSLASSGR